MATDLTVMLDDRPGTLAALGEALGEAGINLGGICCVGGGGGQVAAHVLVEDGAGARQTIESAGMQVVGEREVFVVPVEDTPGEVGRFARRLADAGVNLEVIYLATSTRLAVGADDMEKARGAM
jgi:hypothetical protein